MSGNYDRKDHYYERAKQAGYRSRAAYKLLELNDRFSLFRSGSRVLDLGAWPGGWLQVVGELVGGTGVAVGIDLLQIDPVGAPNVYTLHGDAREDALLKEALRLASGSFDAVLSDMSPKLSGIPEVDRTAAVGLSELAFWVAGCVLQTDGVFVSKVFKSNEAEQFVRGIRPHFRKVVRSELESTRKTSNEFYVVGLGYKGRREELRQ